MNFAARLEAAVGAKGTPLVVGIDPHVPLMPPSLVQRYERERGGVAGLAAAIEEFCHGVLEGVAALVPAVKIQSAFFEQLGPAGAGVLDRVTLEARRRGLLVVFDGKRNDIGSTAEAYAAAYLGDCRSDRTGYAPADAITVNPYLGGDGLEPFVKAAAAADQGVFVLVKTSNPGSADFQDLVCDGRPVYVHVAEAVERLAEQTRGDEGYGAVGAVVGATHPRELAQLRQVMPHAWLLLPGYGAQGASAADIRAGLDARGLGAIVNSSRAILFAFRREPYASRFGESEWQKAAVQATRDAISELAAGR